MGDAVGRIFNIQRFSLDDGEGIRTVVFLKGCPLRCRWCHNAESLSFATELIHNADNCLSCQACASVCRNACHDFSAGHIFWRESCVRCGSCAQICPTGTLEMAGEEITPEELLKRVLRDREYFADNGGITLSGGEPMAQADFCIEVSRLAKEVGITVAIETSGFCKTESFLKISPYVDQFLFDCKAAEKDHKRLTDVEDTLILKNLSVLCEHHADVALRCPIVPGANLCDEFIEKIAELANRYESISSVTLLPYHKTGLQKSLLLGKERQEEFEVPERNVMERIGEQLSEKIKQKVIIK